MKIVVLCGGLSMERNVSLSSGTLVCKALRGLGHQAVLMDLFFGTEDWEGTPADWFENLKPLNDVKIAEGAPDLEQVIASRKWKSPSKIGKGVLETCAEADAVFLALHGTCGEDGRIQAALDLMNVPYTGSGYIGSALAMDKGLTKQLARDAGVLTPEWRIVSYTEETMEKEADGAFLPCVVKPIASGSSIGVSIANDKDELLAALKENLSLGQVILEQYVKGREIDVGVLDGRALPSIEIIPKTGFYDYKNKYQAGAALEICPTPIDPAIEKKLGETALCVHRTLGLSAYSRADFIVTEDGKIWFLEINTLPGMTPTSLLPQEAAQVGIDYPTLCQTILDLALKERK